jgi:ABC-type transporter Mla maintaining outer membrane lipid asymmetry ATPase subunit MlaF
MNTGATTLTTAVIEMREVGVGALHGADRVVAEHVDWTVAPGDFWVIAGLQGTGKSDFLMLAAGLMPPRSGDYRLFGEPMPIFEGSRLAHRLRLGLVFDDGHLLNHLTVFENVALPLRYHRSHAGVDAEDSARALLEATELLPWSASTPGAMPRAWQKRAGLARALALRPDVLLLDCPLNGLDLRHANWWLNFLGALSRGHPLAESRPMTLVVTTEDLRPWRGRARQFALLENQRLTVLGNWPAVECSVDPTVRLLLEGHGANERPPR